MILLLAASCRERGERKLFQLAESSRWGFYFLPDRSEAYASLKVTGAGTVWTAPRSGHYELQVRLLLQSQTRAPWVHLAVKSGGATLYKEELRKFRRFPGEGSRAAFLSREIQVRLKLDRGQPVELRFEPLAPGSEVHLISSHLRAVRSARRPDHPNIILISLDTLRADYLDPYRKLLKRNPEFVPLSPHIARLAAQSTLFLNVQTTKSATYPALASLFTSLYPFQHHVLQNGIHFPEKDANLVKLLFDKGYYTLALNSNAFSLRLSGFHRAINAYHRDWELMKTAKSEIRHLDKKQPFFLWMHFMGVHAAYAPEPEFLKRVEPRPISRIKKANGRLLCRITNGELPAGPADIQHIRNCYAGELLQLDSWLGEIFQTLKSRHLWEDSLVILTSDHGEDLYQHHDYFFHHPSPYQTSLHIPLLMKLPRQKKGAISDRPSSILDIAPTILELLGEKIPAHYQGIPLLRELAGPRALLAESYGNSEILTIRAGNDVLISNLEGIEVTTPCGSPYPIKKYELYDLARDPFEQKDLAGSDKAKLNKMKALLFGLIKGLKYDQRKKQDFDPAKLSPEEYRELKTLGYL